MLRIYDAYDGPTQTPATLDNNNNTYMQKTREEWELQNNKNNKYAYR